MVTRSRRRGRLPSIMIGIGLTAWIVTPLVALGYLTFQVRAIQLVQEETAWAPIVPAEGTTSQTIEIALKWDGGASVVAPSWMGTTQRSYAQVGQVIKSGDPVALVDGVKRIGWAFDVPLYRELRRGDTGDDVAAVNKMLEGLGVEHGTGGEFNAAALRGTLKIAESLGVDIRDLDALDPSWFVYLPAESQLVTENVLTAGGPAPAPGTEILKLAPSIVSATLSGEVKMQDGEGLYVGGEEVRLVTDAPNVDPEGLEFIESIVKADAESVSGMLKSTAEGAWLVPTAAIITDPSGKTCVIARAAGQAEGPEKVTIRGTQDGSTVIDASMEKREQVAVGVRGAQRRCD